MDQYAAFVKAMPAISATLQEMGQLVDGPDEAENAAAVIKKSKKEKHKSSKANIEATSDEDEG